MVGNYLSFKIMSVGVWSLDWWLPYELLDTL